MLGQTQPFKIWGWQEFLMLQSFLCQKGCIYLGLYDFCDAENLCYPVFPRARKSSSSAGLGDKVAGPALTSVRSGLKSAFLPQNPTSKICSSPQPKNSGPLLSQAGRPLQRMYPNLLSWSSCLRSPLQHASQSSLIWRIL